MNMRWNLDKLYTSFESEELKNDIKKLEERIDGLEKWCKDNLSDLSRIKESLRQAIIVDARNIYDPTRMKRLGFTHICVGRCGGMLVANAI